MKGFAAGQLALLYSLWVLASYLYIHNCSHKLGLWKNAKEIFPIPKKQRV